MLGVDLDGASFRVAIYQYWRAELESRMGDELYQQRVGSISFSIVGVVTRSLSF